MNWHTDDLWVDDYVEGTDLAAADHVAVCGRCQALVADLRAVRAMAATLGSEPPPPAVWARVAAAIDAEPKGWSFFSLSTFGLHQAAALAMTLVLAVGLSWVASRLSPAAGPPRGASPPLMTAGVGALPIQAAEAQFATAIAGLEEMTTAEEHALDPDTMGVVRANLSVIDAAIDESRAVLETEPESTLARQSLFEALRSKVTLLQNVLALINEMRKGDPNGAARIVSGLNQ